MYNGQVSFEIRMIRYTRFLLRTRNRLLLQGLHIYRQAGTDRNLATMVPVSVQWCYNTPDQITGFTKIKIIIIKSNRNGIGKLCNVMQRRTVYR